MTQPGMTIVCGDSHTSTHGAFGALAFGIGTSEVEHVLATQTLVAEALDEDMRVVFDGLPGRGVGAKDLILGLIAQETLRGRDRLRRRVRGRGDPGALDGGPDDGLEHVDRVGRAGGPDRARRDDVRLPRGPARRAGAVRRARGALVAYRSDAGASFDAEVARRAARWRRRSRGGRIPARRAHHGRVPEPRDEGEQRALEYMGLTAGTPMQDVAIDRVFIGSCTNSRLGDLRAAAEIVRGNTVAAGVQALVVPGRCGQGRGRGRGPRPGLHGRRLRVAQRRLLHVPGHEPGRRGRGRARRLDEQPQLRGPSGPGRPHAPDGPEMAAAAALTGHLTDVREL